MARICLQLGIDPFAGAFAEQEVPLAAEDEDAARQALLAHAPSQRQASTPVEQLEDYRIALQRIVARPLSGPIATRFRRCFPVKPIVTTPISRSMPAPATAWRWTT